MKNHLGSITTYGNGLHEDVVVDGVPHKIIPVKRIAELEARVTRLQSVVRFVYNEGDEANGHGFDDRHIEDALMLRPGDLDPVEG